MFWLGLLLAIAYVPGWTGASVPTQWAVLSIILPLGLWWTANITVGHKLLVVWVAYAAISGIWIINPHSYIWGLWVLFIWCLAYHWGTLCTDLRPLWRGLALGLVVSAAVAMAQGLDYAPVEASDPYKASGLFYNSSLLGVICGIVLVALVAQRSYLWMPGPALALILSESRGGFVVLAIGLIARFGGPWAVVGSTLAIGFGFILTGDLADSQRLQIWGVTLRALSPFGAGLGSYGDLYYVYNLKHLLLRPEFAHNDPLQLVYEFGPAALAPLAIFAAALVRTRSPHWPILCAWCAASLFYFPLYAPLTAFIGLVMAGSSLRDWTVVWADSPRWRLRLLSWATHRQQRTDHARCQGVPLVARASHEG